jgi:head-tail adaptor
MFGRQKELRNPGRFRHSLTLRPPTGDQGDGGDYQPDWTASPATAIAVRGRWRQTTQRENGMDGGKYSMASGVWEVPWVPGVTKEYRVEFGTREYRIVGIEDLDERGRELHLFCVEDEGARGVNG